MINSQRFRLALVALAASAAALTAVPAQAATPAPVQARTQTATTVQLADLLDSPISPMRCRDDGQGCPPVKEPTDCGGTAPTSLRGASQHMRQRMAERRVSWDDIQTVVRVGAPNAYCQDNGKWRYEVGLSDGRLIAVIGSQDAWGVTVFVNNE
ncbi:hypothetical protein [Streptomyces sp. NBC_01276]|uniref:hypothetical protein n=1 Tax=Streptomyces sp. NBC_01276 TaxID=2903808 RepID=UPI002F90BFCB